ncbi:DUF3035 domain-containing protein [Zavarzinia sp. CC-PAN008]|uniref:DUF3035 domain-containing protein n=1 Tax=Zavarzinia sp. CC-PAN008 TaxID=3243332 RepID=UPI003F7475D8
MSSDARNAALRPVWAVAGALVLAAGLSGCNTVKEQFGFGKQAPDEFAVVANQPLTIPPDFTLRPPEPGAPRPQEIQPGRQASLAMFGQPIVGTTDAGLPPPVGFGTGSAPTAGEAALLGAANATDVDPSIRNTVNREGAQLAEKSQSFMDDVLFWRDPQSPDVTVDAAAEQARLRANAGAGLPPTQGETPQNVPRQQAPLEGIF